MQLKRTPSTMICSELIIPHKYWRAVASSILKNTLPAMTALTVAANVLSKTDTTSGS